MLLLARAANDAAEPWGFSNFCIVAHPCAGHKKSRKTAAPIACCYGCQRRNRGSRNELHSGFSPRRTKKASSPLQYVLRNRRKIHRYSAIKRMLCRRCQAIGEFLKPYASVLVDELPIGGLGRSARQFPRAIGHFGTTRDGKRQVLEKLAFGCHMVERLIGSLRARKAARFAEPLDFHRIPIHKEQRLGACAQRTTHAFVGTARRMGGSNEKARRLRLQAFQSPLLLEGFARQ